MNDAWLIYPATKRAAALLAAGALGCLGGAAVLGAAEVLLAPAAQAAGSAGLLTAAIWSGQAGEFLLLAATACLGLLTAWCHEVLLAARGHAVSRFLAHMGVLLAVLIPLCQAYTLATGVPLLARQAEIPVYLSFFMLIAALFNLGCMAGSTALKTAVCLTPLFLLAAHILNAPGLLPLSTAATLAATATAFSPLRLLATTATRIISLPEKEIRPEGK